MAVGIILSVAAHAALFQLLPSFGIMRLGDGAREVAFVQLPPEVQIPPPPEQVPRPATPKVSRIDISEEITIAPTTFEAHPTETLPPPPRLAELDPSARPTFIPYDVAPRLLNPDEIQRLLTTEYPPAVRQAGIGGSVVVWLFVDETGHVVRTQVQESSGVAALDEVAQRVAARMRFSPALSRDKPTAVWVAQRIHFTVGQRGSA